MAAKTTASEVLLGIEGTAAKPYFAGLKQLFKEETGFELDGLHSQHLLDPFQHGIIPVEGSLYREICRPLIGEP